MVDVGANVGQYATELRRSGYTGRIHSIEPLSGPYADLERAASQDPRWTTQRAAVGASFGSLTINVSAWSIFSSALQVNQAAIAANAGAEFVSTEAAVMSTLDMIVDEQASNSVAVKIDVQGYERNVLEGATSTLGRVRVLEMELAPCPVYDGQILLAEALERLASEGLVLSLVQNLLPEPGSGRALQFNGVFVRV